MEGTDSSIDDEPSVEVCFTHFFRFVGASYDQSKEVFVFSSKIWAILNSQSFWVRHVLLQP